MSGAVEGVALLPCPFCQSSDAEMRPMQTQDKNGSFVICLACSALGPTRRDHCAAITAWNTRITPPARSYADDDAETQWEVWEDDLMVASSTDEADARHYLAVYSQDGPVRLVKSVTVRTPCDPAPVLSQGGKA